MNGEHDGIDPAGVPLLMRYDPIERKAEPLTK